MEGLGACIRYLLEHGDVGSLIAELCVESLGSLVVAEHVQSNATQTARPYLGLERLEGLRCKALALMLRLDQNVVYVGDALTGTLLNGVPNAYFGPS